MTAKNQPDDNQTTAQSSISESSPKEINKSEYSDKDLIADKNSSYKEEQSKGGDVNPTDGGSSKSGYVAFELVKRMEPGNLKALGVYLSYARKVLTLLFQWASEIEQIQL